MVFGKGPKVETEGVCDSRDNSLKPHELAVLHTIIRKSGVHVWRVSGDAARFHMVPGILLAKDLTHRVFTPGKMVGLIPSLTREGEGYYGVLILGTLGDDIDGLV